MLSKKFLYVHEMHQLQVYSIHAWIQLKKRETKFVRKTYVQYFLSAIYVCATNMDTAIANIFSWTFPDTIVENSAGSWDAAGSSEYFSEPLASASESRRKQPLLLLSCRDADAKRALTWFSTGAWLATRARGICFSQTYPHTEYSALVLL